MKMTTQHSDVIYQTKAKGVLDTYRYWFILLVLVFNGLTKHSASPTFRSVSASSKETEEEDVSAESMPNTAPVPDVLLSLAKDDRYIDELSTILGRVIVPYASLFPQVSSDDPEDFGRRILEKIRPELDLVASIIIYSATYVTCYIHGRGENLQTSTQNDENANQRRSVGMESLHLAYRGESKRWYALLFLQTIAPYVIHRVGRGGWSKDLGGAAYIVMDRLGLAYPNSSVFRTNNTEEDEELRNDDRLRGSARRRLFLEQRRRMLDSSNDTSSNENGSMDGNNSTINRIRHESTLINANSVHHHGLSFLRSLGDNERLERISTTAWDFISRVSLAISSLSNGAYSLPSQAGSTTNMNLDRYAAIIKWFLRLHLSLFYWNGMYPTFAHRLVGANIRDEVVPVTSGLSSQPSTTLGSIVANRPSYKPIAAIIFFQAVIALSKTTAEVSIEVAHYIQLYFFRWRRNRRRRMQQQQQSSGNISLNDSDLLSTTIDVEREEYMGMIEDRVPGISSSSIVGVANASSSSNRQKQSVQRGHQCGICLNERVHPAAPTACGHVFCWNCVQHWVSNVRAECPLCRAETRPQDIIPLYNYP